MELGSKLSQDHVSQDFGAVVVVLGGVLDEAEAVHVTDDGLPVGPEQVEAAHSLLEGQAHRPRD